jgi:hypothetical protein
MKIGIDIGNVIIGGGADDTQFFTEKFWETPQVEGARESVYEMRRLGHEIHLISKCGVQTEQRSILWLGAEGFIPTPILERRIHFVRKRHLKAPMAQALELEVFIDDRQDIIDTMDGVVKYPILFTSWEQTIVELECIFASEG